MSAHPTRTIRSVAAAGALALLLAACGDSGTTTTPPPDTAAQTTTTTGDTPTTEPTGTTAPTVGSTTTRAPSGTTGATAAPGTTGAGATTTTVGTTTATAAPPDDALAAALAVREAPLAVELSDGTTVTFSEWFFATFNREATVTVERNGTVLAQGTVVDPLVMEDRGVDGFAFFGPDGDLVAVLSQTELLDAANQTLIDAGLAP